MQRAGGALARLGLLARLPAAVQAGGHQQRGMAAAGPPSGQGQGQGGRKGPPNKPSAPEAGQAEVAFDAAHLGRPRVVHELIGDPRTGVADDTTTNPFPQPVIEWVWSNQSNDVDWYRYTVVGKEHQPYMHMDARLSDHSKNQMYLLRARDPARWTIEALADKFRIRRQRVLAILALKDMEAQAIREGKLLAGPLRAYAFDVRLADVALDEAGEPMELAELAAQQQREQQQQQQQQHKKSSSRSSSSSEGGGEGAVPSPPASSLGSLADFLATDEPAGAGAGPATTTSSQSSSGSDASSSSGPALGAASQLPGPAGGDLSAVLPRLVATAQQLHLSLLELLRQYDYSCDRLQASLLEELSKAEGYYAAHVAGTPLEALLAGPAAEAGGSEAAAPGGLDFGALRAQVEGLVAALRPLVEGAPLEGERRAAQLATQLRQLLRNAAAEQQPGGSPAAEAAGSREAGGGEGDAAAAAAPAEGGEAAEGSGAGTAQQQLQAACAVASPESLALALNQLDFGQRRQLLQLAPAARAQLNVRGVDLRAAAGSPGYTAPSEPGAGYVTASKPTEPPRWPGQAPPLVDLFGFAELPAWHVDGLVEALRGCEAAAGQLPAALGAEEQGEGAAADGGGAGVASADLAALRQVLDTCQHLNRIYDLVIAEQEVLLSGQAVADQAGWHLEERAPPLPPRQQHAMMRILAEAEPHALERLAFFESHAREAATSGRNSRSARRLRQKIQQALKGMRRDQEGTPDAPLLPRKVSPHGPEPAAASQARVSHDLLAAWLDAEVIKRVHHRGSGERHVSRLATYPQFEGYSLEEFDRVGEGELSLASRLASERTDNMMATEFRERLCFELGLTGPGLHIMGKHARPQKPADGYPLVVHAYGSARKPGSGQEGVFVVGADGRRRPMTEDERALLAKRTPKPRARWFPQTRQGLGWKGSRK